jgi:hypothetical protein
MERKVISKWAKKHKGQEMEMVVYHDTYMDGGKKKKTSRTAHEQVKKS